MNLDLATVQNTTKWVLIVIAILGVVAAIIIKKIIGKIIFLVLAAVIVFFGWQQRARVVSAADHLQSSTCATHPKFFGIRVTYPTCKQ